MSIVSCPVCDGRCSLLDVVDFNKSCIEQKGKFLELSGVPVYYSLCDTCGFCFSPEISAWKMQDFEEKIYNSDYIAVDPSFVEARPRDYAAVLNGMFGKHVATIRHLDYGGGNGLLAKILGDLGWKSTAYDPFVNKDVDIKQMGTFDLITAIEVFEHVPDVNALMLNLRSLLAPGGLVIFSTLLSDKHIHKFERLNWWYASPRNGHISLFSNKSLAMVAQKFGFNFGSFNEDMHVLFTTFPAWAAHLVP